MAEGRIKPHDNYRRRMPFFWKLVLSLPLVFGLSASQAANPSAYYMNLTLFGENWVMSEIWHLTLLKGNLPSRKVAGVLVPPEGEAKDACRLETNFRVPLNTEDWIAFIARGGCTFKDKIKAATGKGAAAVIIYDHSCPEQESLILTSEDPADIAAVMISSPKGRQILHLIQEGIRVTAVIDMGKPPCLRKIYLCAYFLILTFVVYVLLCSKPRQIRVREQQQRTQTVKAELLHQAVHSLKLRRLRKRDLDLAEETCAVCLESYRAREVVRILTCRHVFHKKCIDRWLLKRGICPICNCAIIQKN